MRDDERRGLAQRSVIDRASGRLQRRPQEGVGGRPDEQTALPGKRHQLASLCGVIRQGLLAIDVLAGLEHLAAQLVVNAHGNEHNDHLDVLAREKLTHLHGLKAKLDCLGTALRHVV